MENSQNFRCIMSNIITTVGDGIEKFANDVTTATEATLPVLAQASFDLALRLAFEALLAAL